MRQIREGGGSSSLLYRVKVQDGNDAKGARDSQSWRSGFLYYKQCYDKSLKRVEKIQLVEQFLKLIFNLYIFKKYWLSPISVFSYAHGHRICTSSSGAWGTY